MKIGFGSASVCASRISAWFVVSALVLSAPARAAEPLSGQPLSGQALSGQALVIGIQDYELAQRLQGVLNDVESLREVLERRGGYTVETVWNSADTDHATSVGNRSERECLQQRIADWLAKRAETESVLLYFGGHGFRDGENHLYLAAKDCDPKDPQPGGLPIAWLREQLIQCAARSKLLILDTCHAGSARAPGAQNAVTAKELQDFFQQTQGLVTLASCSGDQQSYLWPAKNQSIFTYWLVQGLRGHADRAPLGEITLNELDDYVTRKVRHSAAALVGLEQTPTRLQGPNVSQDVVVRLQPVDLKTLLDDVAEQMDVLIRLGKMQRVGVVPELANDVTCQTLGRQYGALATQCPVELANRLAFKSNGEYRVMSTNAVRELLQSRGIAGKDLGTDKCKDMPVDGGTLSCLIAGHVQSLSGDTIALQCKLLDLASGDELGIAGGSARLCASELAMQGVSGLAAPLPSAEGSATATEPGPLTDGRESAQIHTGANHPLQDPAFPYHVRILVKGPDGGLRERPGTFSGNDCHVRLVRDEVFQIRYRSEDRVFAKVLVDGLNTLPERSQAKGVEVEPVPRAEYRQAQPVSLAEARAWGPLVPGKEYAVDGFYVRAGAGGEYDAFKMVDAAQTVAAGAGYTDQLGLITVAFYEPQAKQPPLPSTGSRGVSGAGRGERYRRSTDTYQGDDEPGKLLAVVHIRYGE